MKTIEEIRLSRLDMLVAEYGSISALAKKLKMSHSQVSQWVNRSIDHKSQKPRTMSSAIARRIEGLTKKPPGWMDQHIYSEDFDRIFSMLMGVGDKKQVLKIESIIRTLVDEDHPQIEEEPQKDHQKINEKHTTPAKDTPDKKEGTPKEERRKSPDRRGRNNGNSSTEYPRWFKHH